MYWTLNEHGDKVEKRGQGRILPAFPLYEEFWRGHVVPLTYRVVDQNCLWVRCDLREELQRLASTHYSVFFHLAAAAEILEGEAEFTRIISFYRFYVDLHAAWEIVRGKFHDTSVLVLEKYGETRKYGKQRRRGDRERKERKHEEDRICERLKLFGDEALVSDYGRLLDDVSDYRNTIHDCVLIMHEGKVPRPDLLRRRQGEISSRYRDLAEYPRLLMDPQEIRDRFVDAHWQAEQHFDQSLKILNRIWEGVIGEFEEISGKTKYKGDQDCVSDKDTFFAKKSMAPKTRDVRIISHTNRVASSSGS